MDTPTGILLFLISLIASFFIGLIPSGFLIGKIRGVDITKKGSGNIGATNVARTGKNKLEKIFLFGLVLILDACKAFLAVHFLGMFFEGAVLKNLLGVAVLLGNTNPFSCALFSGIRRGKGVATSIGVILALAPSFFLFGGIAAFLAMLYMERYVSVASVSAVVFVFTLTLMFFHDALLFTAVASVVVYLRHGENFSRIKRNEEPKVRFFWEKEKN